MVDSLLHFFIYMLCITSRQHVCNQRNFFYHNVEMNKKDILYISFFIFVVVAAMLKKQRLVEQHQSQLSRSDHVVRELQSKESDWMETIRAKDAQLAVLRVRLDEVDKALSSKQSLIDSVQADRDR